MWRLFGHGALLHAAQRITTCVDELVNKLWKHKLVNSTLLEILTFERIFFVGVHSHHMLTCLIDHVSCYMSVTFMDEVPQCRYVSCLVHPPHVLTSEIGISGCVSSTKAVKEGKCMTLRWSKCGTNIMDG
ncbi:hypothetical protein LSAT2_030030 [Lamellibrachia satsuma]|nr:hypothetical protein LSAT2_030030 [Lamellibrachia satsuma]